jgi:hypothetical protein
VIDLPQCRVGRMVTAFTPAGIEDLFLAFDA